MPEPVPSALESRPIAVRALPFEFAMNGFRLVEGFSDQLFETRTGEFRELFQGLIAAARERKK